MQLIRSQSDWLHGSKWKVFGAQTHTHANTSGMLDHSLWFHCVSVIFRGFIRQSLIVWQSLCSKTETLTIQVGVSKEQQELSNISLECIRLQTPNLNASKAPPIFSSTQRFQIISFWLWKRLFDVVNKGPVHLLINKGSSWYWSRNLHLVKKVPEEKRDVQRRHV